MTPNSRPSPVRPRLLAGLTLLAGFALLPGCTDLDTSFDGGIADPVGVAWDATVPEAQASSSVRPGDSPSFSVVTSAGGQTVVVESAKFMFRNPAAGRAGEECNFDSASRTTDTDGCAQFFFGPGVVALPLVSGDTTFQVPIEEQAGTFDRLTFELNNLNPDDPDENIVAGNNRDLVGGSILVQGTFDDGSQQEDFDLLLEFQQEESVGFREPLSLEEGEVGRVDWVVAVGEWFQDDQQDGLIDPAEAAGSEQLRNQVIENILGSFSVVLTQP